MLVAGIAAAVVLALVTALVLVATGPSTGRIGPAAVAGSVLEDLASAEAKAKEKDGRFGSLWLRGSDRTLEARGHAIAADAVDDARAIECGTGWLAGVRVEGRVFLRSSSESSGAEEDSFKVALPDCISAEARDALLADLGVERKWSEPDASRFEAPTSDPGYRPAYHLTPEQRWMNDPQRPFFLDGLWHYYYLYNADYPEGNGTEWFHATSTDLVHWKNEGVAIQKYKNGLGDIETGTAVVDTEGTAGFGKGAVIAILTQQHDGVQRQSLFYSTDKGYSFKSFEQNPVMNNPGQEHWRDPRIVRDEANNQWVMLLAEGHKLGFYTSTNLKDWKYASSFERSNLGILECPDFYQMDVDGDPAKRTWVLAASANGASEGRTTGLAYWTGSWDGKSFKPADDQHQWLDAGPDFYATVTWDDPRLTDGQRKASRHAVGWMNNWAYARELPTEGWFGADSVVRDLRLVSDAGRATLTSTPTAALRSLEGQPQKLAPRNLTSDPGEPWPVPASGAYKFDVELEAARSNSSEARVLLQSGDHTYATVGYDFKNGQAFIARDGDAVAKGGGAKGSAKKAAVDDTYRQVRSAKSPADAGKVKLTIYVDRSSVEVFVNDGKQTLTALTFPEAGEQQIRAEVPRDSVTIKSATITPLATIRQR